ncbi:MAG: hypothetical protein NC223_04210 [Butyrivibrio sp.]|nr:hypothetical protein [Butyrivibrio sp.]
MNIDMRSVKISKARIIGIALFSVVLACVYRLYMLGGVDVLLFNGGQSGGFDASFVRRAAKGIFLSWDTYVFALLAGLAGWILSAKPKAAELIYKYRFFVALAVFVLCVLLGLSGSSIGMWCESFGVSDSGLWLGTSRAIRSDEWAVSTPMMLAQANNGGDSYSYFSDTIRGSLTDYYMGFRQPVYDIAMIFRPFQLGYLFLPVANALSFYWFGRLIALALVSFEFGMLFTKGRRGLSAVFMLLISFAPAVQWWFSTALAELLIYSMLSVVLFDKYAKGKSWAKRIPYTLGILACAGCFIMVLYPAWQVPLVFVLLGLILYVIIENRKSFRFGIKDAVVIAVGCVGVAALILYIMNKSSEAVRAVAQTVYPGERFETGGGCFAHINEYINNLWAAVTGYVPGSGANQCENARFIDLFPLCYIPALVVLIRDKVKDSFLIIMAALSAFFGLWCVAGFPSFLAKITFMYNSPANRTVIIFGFCNIMLLIRGTALMTKPLGRRASAAAAAACVLVPTVSNFLFNRDFYVNRTLPKLALAVSAAVIFAFIFYLLLRRGAKRVRPLLAALLLFVAFTGGALVNPLRRGVDAVDSVEWVREINELGKSAENAGDGSYDGRLWLVDNEFIPCSNLPLLCGRTTFNATAVYPDTEKLAILDPTGRYNNIYNRYAHITSVIVKSGEPYFESDGAEDMFIVYLTLDDAKRLGVYYITSRRDLSDMQTENTSLVRLNDGGDCYIYKLQ